MPDSNPEWRREVETRAAVFLGRSEGANRMNAPEKNAPAKTTAVTPEHLFQSLNAYQLTAAMKAAIELDVFTAIGEGANTVESVSARCKASERGVRILCDYLCIQGFLTKNAGKYSLAPDSAAFLDRRSPAYIGSAARFLTAPALIAHYDNFTETVRRGHTATEGTTAPEDPIWVEFARAMAPLQMLSAGAFAELASAGMKPRKVLDIAAGHGVFGIAVAKLHPEAQIYAADWAPVLKVAEENARKAGVHNRYHLLPGSAFDVDFGGGHDVVLVTNFLHHFDKETNVRLLRKIHQSLVPGGRVALLEFVPDENRVSPPPAAAFSITMLAVTPAGDAYTFFELAAMLKEAGFTGAELHPLPPSPHKVVTAQK
jgi:ubiquinone/menaquinone biosynthesis C-methylase UbiE